MLKKIIFTVFLLFTSLYSSEIPKCVYINSYHEGFQWSDEIEKSIKTVLKDKCEIIQFNMDTKRNKAIDYIKLKALEAKKLIDEVQPKVVITSDDNAAKYLIKPYFRNSKIPFVFCGINWSAKEYEFTYSNITGMIEIIPIKDLYKLAKRISSGNKAIFIGDDTLTDKKDLDKFKKISKRSSIILDGKLVNTLEEWKESYLKAQLNYDFIILGHNSAIKDWNDKEVKDFLLKNSKKFVFTTYSWMMPYSMVGLTIQANEQGEWAAQTAQAIIEGFPISEISITTNKRWTSNINQKLLESANLQLPRELVIKSKKVKMD